jgi:hypothetical protein
MKFWAALFLAFAASSSVLAADKAEGRTCTVTGIVGGAQVRYSPNYNDARREKAVANGMTAAAVSGSVSKEWSELRQNMVVGGMCEIRTGPGAEVRLETPDGCVLRVEENTHVEIAVLRAVTMKPKSKGAAPETALDAKFKLFYGGLIGNIKKVLRGEWHNVEFETPTATAAIRGTVIELEAVKGGNTLIRAFEGTISVAPLGGKPVDVGDGKMVELAPNQKDVAVRDVPKGYKRKDLFLKGERAPAPVIEEGRRSEKPEEALAAGFGFEPDAGDAVAAEGLAAPLEDGVDAAPAVDGQPAQGVSEEYAEYAPPAPVPAAPPPAAVAVEGGAAPEVPVSAAEQQIATADNGDERVDADKDRRGDGEPAPIFAKPDFELSLGMATVNGQPWTRIALGADIPIWKFGVFLDIELFIDNESKLSNKGWDFKDSTAEAVFRKIRYIRYGREDEPLFVKFGGLSNVTLGYGMIVDRFTNMLRYPNEKLLGLQFYVNDISPIGLTVQTLISDFAEMNEDGGVYAARVAARPLKASGIFLLDGLSVGAMYATDLNTHAPAAKWTVNSDDKILMDMREKYKNDTAVFNYYKSIYKEHKGIGADEILNVLDDEENVRDSKSSFALYGLDAGLPIIKTGFLGVDLYGQSAFRADTVRGWGIGAPGVAVKVWKLTGNVEYRVVEGRFTPGYFDAYYLDERYSRGLLKEKGDYIDSVSLSGVFGRLGMDMFGVLDIGGAYQYMISDKGNDGAYEAYEATAGVGKTIMSRIPKFNLAEVYVRNANIGVYEKYGKDGNKEPDGKKAGRFDRSPGMYWGYRLGFEIAAGASLIWDYRYGWKVENGRLVPDNQMLLQTALRF